MKKVDIEYIKKLKKSICSPCNSGFKVCIDLYRFTFYSKIRWQNGYSKYNEDIDNDFNEDFLCVCNSGTFKEKCYWNYMALCARLRRRKELHIDWFRESKLAELIRFLNNKKDFIKREVSFFFVSEFYSIKMFLFVRLLMYYLALRGYTVECSFSDRSESQYLHLMPNGVKTNYIKIRVSYHRPSKNDNSDLFIILK